MCTVTFIPTTGGFHLTANRDEHISRSQALAPMKYVAGKNVLLYPSDTDKHGSWIAAKNNGDLAVLLNGAFIKHLPQPPYRKSRGLILKEIITAAMPERYFRSINLDAVEPFTIILFAGGNLYECRWDEEKKHIRLLNN